MKRIIKILPLLSILFLITSCSQNSKQKQTDEFVTLRMAEEKFLSSLTATDTIEVLRLADHWMESIKSCQFDSAFAHLYEIENFKLIPLTDKRKVVLKSRFTQFPVKSFHREYFSFSTPSNNDVKYRISFNEDTPGACIPFLLNPIKTDGKWYLSLKEGSRYSSTQKDKRHPDSPAPIEVKLSE